MSNSKSCTVAGCDSKHLAKGLCYRHYHAQYNPPARQRCIVNGCNRDRAGKMGYCATHKWRLQNGKLLEDAVKPYASYIGWKLEDYLAHTEPGEPQPGSRVDTPCMIWRGVVAADGYGHVPTPYPAKDCVVHRLVLCLTTGKSIREISSMAYACHKCDNRLCIRPDHLYWGDAMTNNRDTVTARRLRKSKR